MQLQRSGQLWQRISVSGSAGKSLWTILLVGLPCPPLCGVFLRFLGPGSMPFLQATPPSWLLSIRTPHERKVVSVPWPALGLNSFTHRERYSGLLKRHGNQAAQLISGSDSWPCKWNIKHLPFQRFAPGTQPTCCFPTELGLHGFEFATLTSAQNVSPRLESSCHPSLELTAVPQGCPIYTLLFFLSRNLHLVPGTENGGDGSHLQPEEYLS